MLGFGNSKENVDVTLVICPPWGTSMPPLSLAQLASVLRDKDIATKVLDINIDVYNEVGDSFKKYWQPEHLNTWFVEQSFKEIYPKLKKHVKRAAKKILATKADIVGFSVNQSNMLFTMEVIRLVKLKKKDKQIIIGGQVSFFPQMKKIIFDYLNYKRWTNMVDVYVIGEAEDTLLEVVEAIKGGVNPAKVMGTEIYKTWTQIENPERDVVKKLDRIPYPTYEDFDLEKYDTPDQLPILMSRGCIGRCVFCNDHVIAGPYRNRSADHIIKELRHHHREGIKKFSCADLLINGNLNELESLCDKIIEQEWDITFVGQAVVRSDMTDKLLNKMQRAGFHSIVFGVESLCDNTLERMNKYFRMKDVDDLFPRLKKAQIKVFINLIVGFPGETDDDFNDTLANIRKLKPYIDKIMDISPCEIKYKAPLEEEKEKYDYVLPRQYQEWHSNDGSNTFEVRQSRVNTVIALAKELEIALK